MAKTKATPQISMEDEWLADPDLEALLENREAAKEGVAAFRNLDKLAKGQVMALGINGHPKRCGRFLLACSPTKPRSISFETKESLRVSIRTAEASE